MASSDTAAKGSNSRPSWIDSILLSRSLPPLVPIGLSSSQNPVYSEEARSKIADLRCHPALESALHLMNDDLFAAHFLLRKMQEDEWGKWLHAALHLAEGDLSENAKLWYQQVDPPLLSKFYDSPPVASAEAFVSRVIEAHQALKSAGGSLESMDPETTSKNEQVRKQKWDELVTIMRELEAMHGWKEVDGSQFYTKDEDPSHKSNVLGEGFRPAQRFGH